MSRFLPLESIEFLLHFLFEIELLGGVQSTLNADKLLVCMLHEVFYSFIIEICIHGDVCFLFSICCPINSVLGETVLLFQFVCEHKALLNENLRYQFFVIKGDRKLTLFLLDVIMEKGKILLLVLCRVWRKVGSGKT